MNMMIICGRLTRDPEIRNTQSGSTVARYSVAVDRKFRQDGDPEADFFTCVAFSKSAEFAEKYLKKGTKVIVTGRMQQDKYTNNEGKQVTTWQVIVTDQEFAESKKADSENRPADPKPAQTAPKYVEINEGVEYDLPFI